MKTIIFSLLGLISQICPMVASMQVLKKYSASVAMNHDTVSLKQSSSDLNILLEQIVETLDEEVELENYMEDLFGLYENKLDLNNCLKEELELLFFLSDEQIEEILYYRYQNKGFNSIYELQLVKGIDMTDIRNLLPFIKLENYKSISNAWLKLKPKMEIITQADRTINQKAGFVVGEEGEKAYLGNQWHHFLKMRIKSGDFLKGNLTFEKDAGEYMGIRPFNFYDFQSASIAIMPKRTVEQFVIGDYVVGFGQGLAINQFFGKSKTLSVNQNFTRLQGIKAYSSTNENSFLRGAAIRFNLLHSKLSLFFSSRLADADTSGGVISSLYLTGYHRTHTELNKKNTLRQTIYGLDINKSFKGMQMGILSFKTHYELPFVRNDIPYQIYNFVGKDLWVNSIYYRAISGKIQFYGECSTNSFSQFAFLNGIHFTLDKQIDLNLIYRDYSPRYVSFYANAFREGSKVNNEKGVYLGLNFNAIENWSFYTYLDSYKFPWLKYNTKGPSFGWDFYLNAIYKGWKQVKLYGRLKSESQLNSTKSSIRIEQSWEDNHLRMKNGWEMNLFSSEDPLTSGWFLFQDFGVNLWKEKVNMDLRYALFFTPNWNNRIYVYEKDLYQNFSFPVFSGSGQRFFLLTSIKLNERNKIWIKYANTLFSDQRESIGSGNEVIEGNSKSDFKIEYQLKL